MAPTYLKVLWIAPATDGILRPAPGIAYYKKLAMALEADTTPEYTHAESILQLSLKVLCDYKSVMLTLQGNVHVFRTNPSPQFPPPGTREPGRVTIGEKEYIAEIMFVEDPQKKVVVPTWKSDALRALEDIEYYVRETTVCPTEKDDLEWDQKFDVIRRALVRL
jgi:hypothetical protein